MEYKKKHYSQLIALLAIAKGSFISILRSPSSVAFSLGFPIIFILGFVFLDNTQSLKINVGYDISADTSSTIYQKISTIPGIHIEKNAVSKLEEDIKRKKILAIIHINQYDNTVTIASPGFVHNEDIKILHALLQSGLSENASKVKINDTPQIIPGREYKTIDFILPGQLGFALLGASVFGIAFLFFNLRQELVLKRFFATPITKTNILLGETLSRAVFQLIAANIVVWAGVLFFDFTLVHGFWTYIQIMLLSFLALIVFMGCGFMVSGLANSSSAIPSLANIFTLPQFILSGTFFPIDHFPKWLQNISNLLPLTHFNDAMRRISFDGATLLSCWPNILVITLWGIIIYVLAIKFFKWE